MGTVTAESRVVLVRVAGLAITFGYGALVVWLYSIQPQTVAEVTGSLSSTVGAYHVDTQATSDALAFFLSRTQAQLAQAGAAALASTADYRQDRFTAAWRRVFSTTGEGDEPRP